MAEIVLGIGTPHTPQLHTLAKDWEIRGSRDRDNGVELWYRGEKYLWDDLAELHRQAGFDSSTISVENAEQVLRICFDRIEQLREKYEAVKPDIAIICGNDQHELFAKRIQPAFTVIGAETLENMPRTEEQKKRLPPGITLSDHGHIPPEHMTIPGAPELGRHVAEALCKENFDLAWSEELPKAEADKSWTSGMPHAYGFIYRNIMMDNPIPNLPLVLNSFFGPNRPSAERCYKFGQCVGRAIQSWESDSKIAVFASGGLSHFALDRQFDEEFLNALKNNDLEQFFEYDDDWYRAGTSECKNWLMAAGILSVANLDMSILDYQMLIRTEAITGSSCGFAVWE